MPDEPIPTESASALPVKEETRARTSSESSESSDSDDVEDTRELKLQQLQEEVRLIIFLLQ